MFNISKSGFTIRPAEARDSKALRMILPELRNGGAYIVAIDRRSQLVVGAAAITASCRTEPVVGPGVSLEVIEPCRRNGIATALLTQLERAAEQAFGAVALYAAQRVEQGGIAAQGWQWLGFEPFDTVEEHTLPVDQFEAWLGPLVERVRATGRIPTNASIIPLYQANAAAVLQLHLDQMGGDRRELYRKLLGRGPGAFLPRQSRVLLIDDRVKGCILGHRTAKDTVRIDADIVVPSLRGGWANAWLKLDAFRSGHSLGLKQFTFTSFDHYADTRSFTNKLGGATIRRNSLMLRRIAQRDSESV
jgi:GNAT superfamily N-acetyltransferase